jgi:hypothetical protein
MIEASPTVTNNWQKPEIVRSKGNNYPMLNCIPLMCPMYCTEGDTVGSSHPVTDRVGKFLWIQKKADDVSSDVARVHSAIYQNSASMCTAM